MNFARRAFLQLTAGLVGGTLLSPLPWKLADDSAIWSQNWSWRPSPPRGEITKVATTCRLCDGGCGIQARLVNKERAILLEGNPNHPVNKGGICPLGAAGLQFLYADYRIPKPMKQTKKRGDITGFQPIAWNDALAELGGKLAKLRSDGKPYSVACITEAGRTSMDSLWQQFMNGYGSPNIFRMPSHNDSLELAASLTTGYGTPLAFDLEKATYVLSFGANLVEGWGSTGRMQALYGSWRQDSSVKLVQVESRCSMTASKADRWFGVAPGGETAVALAIAHVLVKENRYDTDFVTNNVFGFEDWTDAQGKTRKGFKSLLLSSYAPEQVAAQAGVDASKLRDLAREFAGQKNALVVWGDDQGSMPGNIYHDLAFLALNVLKGNAKNGGLVSLAPTVPLGALPSGQPDELAQKGLAQKRLDLAQPKNVPILPGNGLYAFLDTVAKGGAYPIDVLMVHEANPAYSLPENKSFQAALANVGFMVSFSSYMDETAAQADLIMPNHTAFERYDDVIGLAGAPFAYYGVARPILKPRLETKNTGDVILELGRTLKGTVSAALPWKSYEAFLQERVNGLASTGKGAVADKAGVDLGKLKAGESVKANFKDGADLWKKLTGGMCWYDAPTGASTVAATPSGKLELACQALLSETIKVDDDKFFLPHFAPLSPSGSEQEYPLKLVSYQIMSLANDYLVNPPFMTKTLWDYVLKENDLFVEINPQTASKLGMSEGDRAVLKTPQGEARVRVHLFRGAHPDSINIVQGLGHKAYDEYIQDKGVNANSLIEVQIDPVTGLGTIWATRAQLRRA